jgi:hypothetical protein
MNNYDVNIASKARDMVLAGVFKKTEQLHPLVPAVIIKRILPGRYEVLPSGPYMGSPYESRMVFFTRFLSEQVLPLIPKELDVSCAFNIFLQDCPSSEELRNVRTPCFIFGCADLEHVHQLLPQFGYWDMSIFKGVLPQQQLMQLQNMPKIKDKVLVVLSIKTDGVRYIEKVMDSLAASPAQKVDVHIMMDLPQHEKIDVFDWPSLQECRWVHQMHKVEELKMELVQRYDEVKCSINVYNRYAPLFRDVRVTPFPIENNTKIIVFDMRQYGSIPLLPVTLMINSLSIMPYNFS